MKYIGTADERSVRDSLLQYLPLFYQNSLVVDELMRVDADELEKAYTEVKNVLNQRFILSADTSLPRWNKEFGIPEPEAILTTTTETFTSDFKNKVTGSLAENPSVYSRATGATLKTPYETHIENDQSQYDTVKVLDGQYFVSSTTTNTEMAQQLISFNLITLIKNKYGFTIPGATVTDQVAWLKTHINKATVNWYGFGSSPTGNKAYLAHWSVQASTWQYDTVSHTNSTVTRLSIMEYQPANTGWAIHIANNIDANGYIYFLAYADPSNGTTPSRVSTDFVNLDIEWVWERYEKYVRSIEDQRNLLQLQLRSRFTLTKDFLKEMCGIFDSGDVEIDEDFTNYEITIRFTSVFGTPTKILDLTKLLRSILPAHINFKYMYRYSTWNEIDNKNNTWTTIDSKNLLWNQVDSGGLI